MHKFHFRKAINPLRFEFSLKFPDLPKFRALSVSPICETTRASNCSAGHNVLEICISFVLES